MKITSLKTNHIKNPIGYQLDTIYLSWIVKNAGGKFCKELRIVVSDNLKFEEKHIVYDSGKLYNFKYNGLEVSFSLKPRTRYYWKVYMLADNGGKAVSDIAYFETGKYKEKWDASWITVANTEVAMPCIYKNFNVKKEIKQARMHIYGLGLYEAYLNEEMVCDEYLLPGYHSYDLVQEYQTFDITPYINQGKNEIKIILGNGWYKGRFVFEGGYENLYGDKVLLIAEIYIDYMDGSVDKIITDNTWESKETHITENNIYDGETIDKTRQLNQLTVLEVEESYDKLIERINLPIKKVEQFKPVRLIETPKGEKVLDFGEMITGWVELLCNEAKGHKVSLYYGEIMQKGNFYNENLRTAKAEFHYITDGIPRVARPHFTYYSFRYVKVDGVENINLDDFTAYRLMSDLDVTGNITTSNPLVNQLFDNTMRSQKCNFLDIPTDCPQRDERLGWTGDVTIFASTSCFNMNTPAFYDYYLTNLRKEQELLDGAVPFFVPFPKPEHHHGINPFLVSAGVSLWGDVACVLPWTLYEHYRDMTMLRKHYPIMKSWVTYVEKRASHNNNPYLWQNDDQLGDWLAL
ncbi:MAG TPA: family 78 glycoside hydrolase catalytic domain, partial [Epulopiscium sp.]|nr:family 78 glycoside hydrolase catalytic domain [Candidatus Epulonipiscium sp.]